MITKFTIGKIKKTISDELHQYYESNNDLIKSNSRKYRKEDKDLIQTRKIQDYAQNRDKICEKQRKCYDKNVDFIIEKKKELATNKKKSPNSNKIELFTKLMKEGPV